MNVSFVITKTPLNISTASRSFQHYNLVLLISVLDEIGHGVRSATPRLRQRGTSQSSIQSLNSSVGPPGAIVGPAPTTKPPTPPAAIRGTGTLSKNSRDYRAPPIIAPPQVSVSVWASAQCRSRPLTFHVCPVRCRVITLPIIRWVTSDANEDPAIVRYRCHKLAITHYRIKAPGHLKLVWCTPFRSIRRSLRRCRFRLLCQLRWIPMT